MSAPITISTDLTGQTALITGASSGLGARFARVLAAAGAQVLIVARRADRLQSLRDEIIEQGGAAQAHTLDVADIAKIPQFYDGLDCLPDILVNNAGMNINKTSQDISAAEYEAIMTTNLTAPFFLASDLARRHIAAKSAARIINIASVGAFNVLPGLTPYCMSKSALVMMTRGMAREWARHNINVNAICPGYIETEINDYWWKTEGGQKQIARFPRKRLAEDSDLDGTLLLLAGAGGKGITGTAIQVDDGQYV